MIEWDEKANDKLYEVTGCNEKHTCPLSLKNTDSLLSKLTNKLEEMNITGALFDKIEGPVVYHHTFRVTVSECPNACSQPQIKDFGVIAESLPGLSNNECINCNLCMEECKESALTLTGPTAGPSAITILDNSSEIKPVLDYSKCVRCDACVRVCPVETLITKKQGYSVFVGGKLGRHPQFAIKILDLVDEDTVVKTLEVCVNKYLKKSKNNERFGNFVNRVITENNDGANVFKELIKNG